MTRIDPWELQTIERIKQVANQIRTEMKEVFDRSKEIIQTSLHQMTDELDKNRRTEDLQKSICPSSFESTTTHEQSER